MLSKFFGCLVNNIVNTLNFFSLLDAYKICRCLIKIFECLPQLRLKKNRARHEAEKNH